MIFRSKTASLQNQLDQSLFDFLPWRRQIHRFDLQRMILKFNLFRKPLSNSGVKQDANRMAMGCRDVFL